MTQTLHNLSQLIEQKREQMIATASKYGIENDKTLKCSQELDKLIWKHQKAQQSKNRDRKEPFTLSNTK
ncbi:Spo0E family sporulation regulatory protein-aspartic acid phosphatase [Lentibacillus salinarum]|uniref:Spo0E family sporulation regulatory protein-aspartic acid phosphatase n=1 Tax=Lentibacillus salinarum TaxID=446820 RepID=A0ABW3ZXN0_9BACI